MGWHTVVPFPPRALQADVARQVLRFAGLPAGEGADARIQVVTGPSGDVLPRLRELAGLPAAGADAAGPPPVSFLYLDHAKQARGGMVPLVPGPAQ